jgi:hypothetical protein
VNGWLRKKNVRITKGGAMFEGAMWILTVVFLISMVTLWCGRGV